ncbi:hypothetical protein CLV62_1546 [Dysgonomonas alginatilytica]|uniref:Uncharacterized protein n=1 Tax=Dysgonomonas alginatilytica TaxID=1605892 RepID=A0A2V3PJ67_9BACT|nr:hypothetical protein CLV62_1546 [Dysgonomonas alginatilytica]
MEELVWNYLNVKLFFLLQVKSFIKYDEEPLIFGQDIWKAFHKKDYEK